MTLNIGDKVLLRDDLEYGKWYGEDTFAGQRYLLGNIVRVERFSYCGIFKIREDTWWYTPEMCVGKVIDDNRLVDIC